MLHTPYTVEEELQVLEEDLKDEMEALEHAEFNLDHAMGDVERTKQNIRALQDRKQKLTPIIYPEDTLIAGIDFGKDMENLKNL